MTPQDQPPPSQLPRAGDDAPPSRPAASGSSGARWAGGIVLALVLYVLSIGPAAKLVDQGILSESTGEIIYAPIIWMIDHTQIGGKYLAPGLLWWMSVWDVPL